MIVFVMLAGMLSVTATAQSAHKVDSAKVKTDKTVKPVVKPAVKPTTPVKHEANAKQADAKATK